MPRKKKITGKSSIKEREVTDINIGENIQEPEKPRATLGKSWRILLVIVIFFALGSFIYKNKGLFVAGFVNNKPIISLEIYKRLINQYGKQTLDQIVVEELIFQEATSRKIVVTEDDLNKEVARIEENLGKSTSLADALKQQNMTLEDLRNRIKLQLIASKLVEDKVKITDEEIDKYMKDNKDYLPKDEDAAKQRESVISYLRDQKINEEIQKLVGELKNSAKISTFL